jgi:hypothetical protein
MRTQTGEEKKATGRRGFLLGGAAVAAAGLTLLRPQAVYGRDPLPEVGTWPWPEKGLDAASAARGPVTGLRGCGVVSFALIRNELAAALPDSIWKAIPPEIASGFNGGGPYGSDCGGLQGPLLIMTLLGAPLTLKQEFYKWYCDFNFPSTEWDDLYPFKRTIQTVSHSPLCHESRAVWESAYLHKAYDGATYDDTRCAKLPRDCARKAVELINAWKANGYVGSWAPDESFRACYDCHTQLNTKKLPVGIHSGKEDCTRCHTVAASHATRTPRGPEK